MHLKINIVAMVLGIQNQYKLVLALIILQKKNSGLAGRINVIKSTETV